MMREYDLFIDGKHTPATRSATTHTQDPATGRPVAIVAQASARDARRAADAARRAIDVAVWRELAPRERAARMAGVHDVLFERQAEIADLDVAETGTPIRLAYDLTAGAVGRARERVTEVAGTRSLQPDALGTDFLAPRALGVVALAPYDDAPFARALAQIFDAVLAGNAVVVRAAPGACSSAMEIAAAFSESDVPAGIVNVLSGNSSEVLDELSSNTLVDLVAFSGSTSEARRVAERAAPTLKRVRIDVAGGGTAIVLEDADLDRAVPAILWGATALAGRTPRHCSRIIVSASIAEPLAFHLARGTSALRVGQPTDFATDVGPLPSRAQVSAFEDAVARGLEEGARLAAPAAAVPSRAYVAPVSLVAPASSRLAWDGIPGPAAVVVAASEDAAAAEIANRPPARAAVSIWSRDAARAMSLARRLDAEIVWLNDYLPAMPHGDGVVIDDDLPSTWDRATRVISRAHQPPHSDRRFALGGIDRAFGFD